MYHEIKQCRAGGLELDHIYSLGTQAMSGLFPKPGEEIEFAPLDLVWSEGSGLLQLKHSCDPVGMYGSNYGYRSGLNGSMITHLQSKAEMLSQFVGPKDVILDIGSNDGTLLSFYKVGTKIAIDPTGKKFQNYYTTDVYLIPEFFSTKTYFQKVAIKAKLITTIAMFYDLADPIGFAKQVGECLDDDGIWHLEQSYLPTMLRQGCYDTICHEHLEYYSLTAIKRILELAGLHIYSVTLNDVNGGSFALNVGHHIPDTPDPEMLWLLREEKNMNMKQSIINFVLRMKQHKESLLSLLSRLNEKKVIGYGASTKGNTVLQYCGIGTDLVSCIAEVNSDKFGCLTPGSKIPIVSELEAKSMKPDYMLVLPWHFKTGIIKREREYLNNGGKLIFPFPYVEIVG